LRIYEKLVRECGRRGLHAGIHCSGAARAVKAIETGFRLVTLASDSSLLATFARMQVAQTRAEAGGLA